MTRASRICAVDHVHLEAPAELEEDVRWFYAELAGLKEVGPGERDTADLCFRSERLDLRVRFCRAPQVEAVARRLTILVPSVEEIAEQLLERRLPVEEGRGLAWTDRWIEACDPAGHRVRFRPVPRCMPF
ncbi:MAG: VOC family protein [Phycisphaerae bacterium]